jgi:hypothetical protein
MVLAFPTPQDREAVKTAVQIFLGTQSARARQLMLRAARTVLDRYGISKLPLDGYCVLAASEPGWAVIRSTRLLPPEQRHCPGCGASIYDWPGDVKIVSIKEERTRDIVTYGCRCGEIFAKVEPI